MADAQIPVECIVEFDIKGNPKPIRIRFEDAEGLHVINIDKILEKEDKKGFGTMNGNAVRLFVYKCQSVIDGIIVPLKLTFENKFCKWNLVQKKE